MSLFWYIFECRLIVFFIALELKWWSSIHLNFHQSFLLYYRFYLFGIWFGILSMSARSRRFSNQILRALLQRTRRRPALPVLFWVEQGSFGCSGYVFQARNALQQLPRLLWRVPKMSRGGSFWSFGHS